MKKIIITGMLSVGSVLFGQIGINTPDPKATFDINAKSATGTSPTAEGLLVPRVDRQRAQSMTGVQTSTLIYINSISTGTQTGTAINVDVIGYYYFNGTEWAKLNSGSNETIQNFYNSNGTLTGNRTVSQGASTLAFTGTATNAFSVDDTTFSVDAANNRVGIGNNNPSQSLTVVDPTNLNRFQGVASFMANNLTQGVGIGYAGIQAVGANASVDFFLNAKGTGNIILQTESTGNVGIGTVTPNSNAILDLYSTSKGFLPPRLTTAQRNAIATKPAGLMVYNSNTNRLEYWNSTAWVAF